MSQPAEGRPEHEDGEPKGPTVRDRRRIDPETYQLRDPAAGAQAPAAGEPVGSPTEGVSDDVVEEAEPVEEAADVEGSDRVAVLEQALGERTLDLQRLQAEYVNYKRRVDRDRELSRAAGAEKVLKDLLSVLDDVASAREHGELNGAFKAVGEELEKVTGRHGIEAFGTAGDPFDPQVHEALMHAYAEDISVPTCVQVLQTGYRLKERVLRPARVAVAEPSGEPAAPPAESGGENPPQ